MNGIERRQYEMLVRVRNFGETNHTLFESSPVAQEMFTAVGAAIDDLGAADVKKMAASASARARNRETTRTALRQLLQNVGQLAKTLTAEGRALPAFDLPRSKSAVALLTTGRQFAEAVQPFDAEFAGHGLGAAHIVSTTAAFEDALKVQGVGRSEHVVVSKRIGELFAGAMRCVRRLDVIVATDLHDGAIQAEWKRLRHLEDARLSRGGSGGGSEPPAPTPVLPEAAAPVAPAAPPSPTAAPPPEADDGKPTPQAA